MENNDIIGSLVLSGPVSDTFGARLAVHARNADGYVDNITLDRDEPGRDELAVRVILAFDPTETPVVFLADRGWQVRHARSPDRDLWRNTHHHRRR